MIILGPDCMRNIITFSQEGAFAEILMLRSNHCKDGFAII